MCQILFKLQEQGASIVPIVEGKKSIQGWSDYGKKSVTKDELQEMIAMGPEGYAIMMGYGGFNCIDIDAKNMPEHLRHRLFPTIWNAIPQHLKSKLTVQRTRNGGEHLIYKCAVSASEHLRVANPENRKTILETVGSKNYLMIEPSPGYNVVSGSLENVYEISEDDHELLWWECSKAAKTLCPPQTTKAIGRWDANKAGFLESTEVIEFIKRLPKADTKKQKLPTDAPIPESREVHFISASAANLESSGEDITSDYFDWVRVGYSIANEMGEAGREHFHKISANSPDYTAEETDTAYDNFLHSISQNKVPNPATGATLRHIMKKNGIEPPSDDTENKTAWKTQTVIAYIKDKGLYRNDFSSKVEQPNGELLSDSDFDTIYVDLRSKGIAVSKSDVGAIINSHHIKRINPLQQWLFSAEKAANVEALDDLLDCFKFKVDDPGKQQFYRKLAIKWLLQIPAMILDGKTPRLVLVLIGGTYIGKSEFFRRLLPSKLSKYYAESALDRDKDSDILMTEHLIINVDELAGIMKSPVGVERFKAASSAQYFTLRTPYGKVNERFNRKALLCGTSNKIEVIQDHDTGNSRIIPLELMDIDKTRYNAIDRDALFGALSQMYREVEPDYLQLTPDELDMLKSESGEYTVLNVEQELIQRFFRPGRRFMSITEICDFLGDRTKLPIIPRNLSREMKKSELKFEKGRKRIGTSHVYGYHVALVEEVDPGSSEELKE